MKRVQRYIALVALAAAGLCGCSDPTDAPGGDDTMYDIVTYAGMSDATPPVAVFEYQVRDDSPVITLTANCKMPESVTPGRRILLAYRSGTPGESGPVEVSGVGLIATGNIAPAETAEPSQGLHLRSIWRTGNYLNLDAAVDASGKADDVKLYVLAPTLGNPVVEACIVLPVDYDRPPAEIAERRMYASWDISAVWSLPTLASLQVNYTDMSGQLRSVSIDK